MSRRSTPSRVEEEPFTPTEPWWRQSRRGQGAKRSQEEDAPHFQTVPWGGYALAPSAGERTADQAPANLRVSGAAIAAIIVALALMGGLGFLVTTDWLAVTRTSTEIRGAQRISEDTIYAASQIEGVNIFQVHPGRVAERIKRMPGIAEVAVHPRLPYQVTIAIREETPFVIWQGITTTTWLAENGATVPAIGAPPLKLIDPAGAAAEGSGKLRSHVLADLKALRAAGLEASELYYGAQEGLYFRSADGWTVYLGDGGQMGIKLATLRKIKGDNVAGNARARIIDLRFNGRAQVR